MGSTKSNKKMSKEEKEQWNKLYEYVKKEILLYDKSQSIPSSLILRLKGLSTGKFYENKHIEDKAQYTYEIILYTFQINKTTIMNVIKTKEFKNESAKFNYICKIIENNLNDVYLRLNKAKESMEKTSNLDTNNIFHDGAEYQKKTIEKRNNKLEELW